MTRKEIFHGVEGILDSFKEFLETRELKKGDQIVYYGAPGTCTPFVEMLGPSDPLNPNRSLFR